MATSGSIEALAREHWTNAAHISLTPAGTGHVGFTGPDPTGFRLVISEESGDVIALFNAKTLDELDSKVRLYIDSEDTVDGRN
jgi:hypothetical protein